MTGTGRKRLIAAALIAVGVIVLLISGAMLVLGMILGGSWDIDATPAEIADANASQLRFELLFGGTMVLGAALIAGALWKLPWSRPRGLCARCDYDRTGLAPTAVCPECGKAPAPTT